MPMLRALVVGALALALSGPAEADLDKRAATRRTKRLKFRAKAYTAARKSLSRRCGTCNGVGKQVRIKKGTGGHKQRQVDCGPCCGTGRRLSQSSYFKLEYHLKSPSFRMRPDAYESVERAFAMAARNPPPKLSRVSVVDARLHTPTHGITMVRFNREKNPHLVAWIWVKTPQDTGDWYLYDKLVDGAWPPAQPITTPASPGEGPEEPEEPSEWPLEGAEREAFDQARAKVSLVNHVERQRRTKDELTVTLRAGTGAQSDKLHAAIEADAVGFLRPLWKAIPDVKRIRFHFHATFKDRYGKLETKPYAFVHMDRTTFDRIRWENLTQAEVFKLFHADWKRHAGWTLH